MYVLNTFEVAKNYNLSEIKNVRKDFFVVNKSLQI
jgi:hypothetical protein